MKKLIDTTSNRFNQYLKSLREHSGNNASAIAKQLNIHRNSQVNYETDRDPSIDYLLAFADIVGISFWQLMGERIRLSNNPQQLIDKALNQLETIYADPAKDTKLNLFETESHLRPAGLPKAITLSTLLQQMVNQFDQNHVIAVYQQKGHAMIPKIYHEDWLVIDTNDTIIEDGMIYFIKMGDNYGARRIQTTPDLEWIITSDNPQFAPITITAERQKDLKVIGRMIYFFSQC